MTQSQRPNWDGKRPAGYFPIDNEIKDSYGLSLEAEGVYTDMLRMSWDGRKQKYNEIFFSVKKWAKRYRKGKDATRRAVQELLEAELVEATGKDGFNRPTFRPLWVKKDPKYLKNDDPHRSPNDQGGAGAVTHTGHRGDPHRSPNTENGDPHRTPGGSEQVTYKELNTNNKFQRTYRKNQGARENIHPQAGITPPTSNSRAKGKDLIASVFIPEHKKGKICQLWAAAECVLYKKFGKDPSYGIIRELESDIKDYNLIIAKDKAHLVSVVQGYIGHIKAALRDARVPDYKDVQICTEEDYHARNNKNYISLFSEHERAS